MSKPNDDDILAEFQQQITQALADIEAFDQAHANRTAAALITGIQERFGGRSIYIPAAKDPDRDTKVREAFTGKNREEVMRQFDISQATLYRIIGKKPKGDILTAP